MSTPPKLLATLSQFSYRPRRTVAGSDSEEEKVKKDEPPPQPEGIILRKRSTSPTPVRDGRTQHCSTYQEAKRLRVSQADTPEDLEPVHQRRLVEYKLISSWRASHKATVDDFHTFLLSLRHCANDRYWALIACLLSVQVRDTVSLPLARKLMKCCPRGPEDILSMDQPSLENLVRSCNYYRTKAKNIRLCTEALVSKHDGTVPSRYADIISLPGVGPKIAHLMRSVSFGKDDTGIVVDTHVHRVSRLLEWLDTNCNNPEQTRLQLEKWVPMGTWTDFSANVVGFGQFTQTGAGWCGRFRRFVETKYGSDSSESIQAEIMVHKLSSRDSSS